MTGDGIPSLIMEIMDELRAHGILITCVAGEWRVNFRGSDATAYVTDDLQDAFDRGRAMALAGRPPAAEPVKHEHTTWRRPRTAKASRRAFIRAHNRRMRGRALRNKREKT
jgi:hypothetical protein